MKNFIYLSALFIGICGMLNGPAASAKNTKDTSRTFRLSFFDTVYVLEAKLLFSYDDSHDSDKFVLLLAAGKDTTRVVAMSDLDYRLLEDGLNRVAATKDIKHSVTRFSVYEVFYWLYFAVYGESKRPPAGELQLATEVRYFVDNEDEEMSYEQRVRKTDSLIDLYKYVPAKIADLDSKTSHVRRALDTVRETIDSLNSAQKKLQLLKENLKKSPTKALSPELIAYLNSLDPKIQDLDTSDIPKARRLRNRLDTLLKHRAGNYSGDTALLVQNIIDGFNTLKRYGILGNAMESDNEAAIFKRLNQMVSAGKLSGLDVADVDYLTWKLFILTEERLRRQLRSLDGELESLRKGLGGVSAEAIEKQLTDLRTEAASLTQQIKDAHISRVIRVDVQIERGFIENIKVILLVDGREAIFENSYAIGFTSKNNYRAFAHTKLFSRLGNNRVHIWLSDAIRNYDNEIDLYTRDYSPADTLVKVDPSHNPRVSVFKANDVNLLDLRFFTDLAGLAAKEPNGLVQAELSRKLNINTRRKQVKNEINWGIINYLHVYGTLNKIENNLRYLPLRNQGVVVNGVLTSPSYATTLDFLQYRNITLGSELNIYLYDVPHWKNTFTADIGFQYGHTPVVDSVRTLDTLGILRFTNDSSRLDANLFTIYPRFGLEVFSERRFGVSFAYQPQFTRIFTNNAFKQIMSYAKSDVGLLPVERRAHWSHMFEVFARLELNRETSSKLFFRGRFFWQQGDVNTYFPQLQLGYSHNLKIPKLER